MGKTTIMLITGFLGAGKTTVLNHLLQQLPAGDQENGQPLKVGVVVNEFGKASIDAPFLAGQGYQVTELNNGSIFCQCLAATFIDTMAHLLSFDLDYLLIEGSGLADPAGMNTMMDQLKQKTERPYRYAGSICVIDALYYRKLSQSLETINRQILASTLIVINKADLVDPATLAEVSQNVSKRNPLAEVVTVSHGQLDPAYLARLRKSRLARRLTSLNTPGGRPETLLLLTDDVLEAKRLAAFSARIITQAYRVKGMVRLAEGLFRLDAVGQDFSLTPLPISSGRSEIVVIAYPGEHLRERVAELARDILQVEAELA